ncbi:hypothetical protein ACS0TY_013985 [Phlomoides rotata]
MVVFVDYADVRAIMANADSSLMEIGIAIRKNRYVKKDLEGSSMQWDDIQTRLGNLPPKPPTFKRDPFTPIEDEHSEPKSKAWINDKTKEEFEDLKMISMTIISLKNIRRKGYKALIQDLYRGRLTKFDLRNVEFGAGNFVFYRGKLKWIRLARYEDVLEDKDAFKGGELM